ncbi:16S rRNA (guanine(527)-N(7))-methyltransferase RsmG [Halioxenophilus aromaticivorans]|uniref:Ribosomal RNA small subunit methyltransferase G n=2 Tax=Halioxenophilus aromaticivorans TaxID=1306992 RepID=A0AAV3U7V0_9ALTE
MQTELTSAQQASLRQGCAAMEIALSETQCQLLGQYLVLFHKWNKAYNLSSVRKLDDMVGRHVLDSLSVLNHLANDNAQRFIDVGTGGGLPGIPLAIALPHWQWTLLDSNGKKTRFLTEVVARLQLSNVQVANVRVEAFTPEQPFDGVISRAFASLEDMITGCRHLLTDGGYFWAMKGQYPSAELDAKPGDIQLLQTWPLEVPGEVGERHLLQLRKG